MSEALRLAPLGRTDVSASAMLVVLLGLAVIGCSGEQGATTLSELFHEGAVKHVSASDVRVLVDPHGANHDVSQFAAGRVSTSLLRPDSANASAAQFARLTSYGHELARSLAPMPRAVAEVPYWASIARGVGASADDRAYVATNLLYAIYLYSPAGAPIDSIASPPSSWRQARRPEMGEFPPNREAEFDAYLRTFSVLTALAVVSDSVLVVAYGHLEAGEAPPRRAVTTTLDVYVGERRIGTNLSSPGEPIAYSASSVFFLRRTPGGGGTVTEYLWRSE